MVLLTAVPVSAPGSMVTGVMVATGTPPAVGAAAGAGGGVSAAVPVSGGALAAVSSPPPNRLSKLLSISEQAAKPRDAVSAQARKRLCLSPGLPDNPLISALRCRRLAVKRPRRTPPRLPLHGGRAPALSLNEGRHAGQGQEGPALPYFVQRCRGLCRFGPHATP